MALSRFWLAIFIFSILFIFLDLVMDKHYSLDHMINGKKDDKILIAEKYPSEISSFIWDSLQKNEEKIYLSKNTKTQIDTIYQANLQTVKVYYGTQKSDGLLPTCKSSIFDIILPLMAYLAFFCGILQLLIDSGATEKLAKFSSPLFVKIFPSLPQNHESISYMTLNFAANFLGLDSAATPFGLKAMQSLQEINPDKDKASDAQIMFMCLHAAGLTLIPTSIIGYRAAQNAANPADVMLPCIITSFIGTLAALIIVGIKQKINFKSRLLLLSIFGVIGGIIGLLLYINQMGLIAKNHFTGNLSTIILLLIILITLLYAFSKEKLFTLKNTSVFNSFVTGANSGVQTGVTIFLMYWECWRPFLFSETAVYSKLFQMAFLIYLCTLELANTSQIRCQLLY